MPSARAPLVSQNIPATHIAGAGARRVVAVLSAFELESFFPDGLAAAGAAHGLPEIVLRAVPEKSDTRWSWREFLEQERPDVLIGGWDMPGLPAPAAAVAAAAAATEKANGEANGAGAGVSAGEFIPKELWPDYVCVITGTVRKKIPRGWIEQGLLVSNWGDSCSRVVAENALMLILGALRCVAANQHNLHHVAVAGDGGGWKLPGRPEQSLFGRRVGLHGFGRVAQALARLLEPFGVALSTFAPGTPAPAFAAHGGVRRCASLEELFATSDVLVELAPLNPRTQGIVGRELLRLLPEGAVFVNTGRGAVVREAELLEVALARRLRVALDVFEREPLPADSPLRARPEILLMPHQGGPTPDRCRDAGDFALRQIAAWLRGGMPQAVITAEVWDMAS
jgi:phosphoglycerate dehydrogenase-like enzyme